jgi:hypothetical protein
VIMIVKGVGKRRDSWPFAGTLVIFLAAFATLAASFLPYMVPFPLTILRRPEFLQGHYVVFHTGPSATADIEGVLIHGAQGVRTFTVLPLARAAIPPNH